MKNLLDKKIIASDLLINKVSAKDLCRSSETMNGKSKVGNYPSQLLKKIDFPINISMLHYQMLLLNTGKKRF